MYSLRRVKQTTPAATTKLIKQFSHFLVNAMCTISDNTNCLTVRAQLEATKPVFATCDVIGGG